MLGALAALAHNGLIVRNVERTLQQIVENENCVLYLVNPDGTKVRIQPGCKIEDYEMITISHNKEL